MKHRYRYLNAEMPGKAEVRNLTPNPGTQELLAHLEAEGVETYLDRFEAQQPLCGFGLQGICCQRCLWGPCRISPRAPRGTCGADANLIIMGNLLRGMAAGCSAHGRHAQEVLETVIAASEGKTTFPIRGADRVYDLARRFGLPTEGRPVEQLAGQAARILLEDLGRIEERRLETLYAFAPAERIRTWEGLGIMPRSAMYEVFEALHMTTLGACADWRELARQDLRTGLAYAYSTLFGASLATEMLFGIPEPTEAKLGVEVNYALLNPGGVNLLLHGHSPIMAEKVVEVANLPETKRSTREAGAEEIVLAGVCCTGNELLNRYGIPPLTNILGIEMALGTGAVDALVMDMQCTIPGIKTVADCFGTELITTSRSNRFPGATHLPLDLSRVDDQALEIVTRAIKAFGRRDRSRANIPATRRTAMAGWSTESVLQRFGGADKLVGLIRSGRIKGVVSIAGCNTPKVPFENSHVTIATRLVEYGCLILTTGCAAYALLNAGLASPDAAELAPEELRGVCREYGIPPVLHLGACTDNARMIRLYCELAEAAARPTYEMPFCHSGPEPGNEKNIGQGVQFLCHGIHVHQGFPGGIPVPVPAPVSNARYNDELELKYNDVARLFGDQIKDLLGAKVFTEPYPRIAAKLIQMHIRRQRQALGW